MEQHESPLDDARQITVQQVTQIISLAGTAAQLAAQRIRERRQNAAIRNEERREEERKLREAAIKQRREKWAPALDDTWLAQADLLQVARIWGDAASVAQESPLAAEVVKKCEGRLRQIHPHAMQHYDRLLSCGLHRADAMVRAAPFFARNPNIRTGYPAPYRPGLEAGEEGAMSWALQQEGPTAELVKERMAEERGRSILEHVRRTGQSDPAELRTVLLNRTNLAPEVITKLVDGEHGEAGRNEQAAMRTARADATPATKVAPDFPHDIDYAVAHAGRHGTTQGRDVAKRTPDSGQAPGARRGLS